MNLDRSYAYLYGLSDFWVKVFQESEVPEVTLEAQTVLLSEIYSKFLQRTSGISLESVQQTVGSSLQLALVDLSTETGSGPYTYRLPESVSSTAFLADRPILSTNQFLPSVHFNLSEDGSHITFPKKVTSYPFAQRSTVTGGTVVALWFSNATLDEKLIADNYGDLLSISPQSSTDAFYNYVYGMYHLRAKGPTLSEISTGFNLSIGIPSARNTETVLDVRRMADTGNHLVITDQNSYEVPYGLPAKYAAGEVIPQGRSVADWVEIADYKSNKSAWMGLRLPSRLIPGVTPAQSVLLPGLLQSPLWRSIYAITPSW